MLRARIGRTVDRVRQRLRDALVQEHTPRQVAASFAIGTFITMLPTLGTGLLLFVVLAALFDRINKIALGASVLVFNPVVKWGVYVGSFVLGVLLLGPIEGASATTVSLSDGSEVLYRLLLGNLILAVIATAIAYPVAYRVAVRYDESPVGQIVDDAVEDIADVIGEH